MSLGENYMERVIKLGSGREVPVHLEKMIRVVEKDDGKKKYG